MFVSYYIMPIAVQYYLEAKQCNEDFRMLASDFQRKVRPFDALPSSNIMC